MLSYHRLALAAVLLAVTGSGTKAVGAESAANAQYHWRNGPSSSASYFPIGVWLQDPRFGRQYREAGFNLYVGLWQGPTEEQIAGLKAAGMPAIVDQNEVGLAHKSDPIIVGWLQQD